MNPALLRVLNSRINSWCRRSTPCSWICWCRHPAAWRGRMQSPKTPNLSGCPCRPGRKDEIYHQQYKRTRLIGMYPCYLVQDEWSPRVSLAGVSSSLGKACNNNCATFNHPLTLEPAHQRIYGEKPVTKLLPLTGTEEGIFVYLLLPVVAVEPILAFVAAYHLKKIHLQTEEDNHVLVSYIN